MLSGRASLTFDDALEQVCENGGSYELFVLMKTRRSTDPSDTKPCTALRQISRLLRSQNPKSRTTVAAGESAANDPNVMHRVAICLNPGDIKKVLDALEH